jgi:nucleoid DNA-binding protein
MAVKKKASNKKTAAPAKKAGGVSTKQTKAQIIDSLATDTGLTKKDVAAVFASLGSLIARHMKRNGSGEFQIPDTGVKIARVKKPARKSRMGRNPATGEEIKIAAKPAYTGIKVTALKALKETVKG